MENRIVSLAICSLVVAGCDTPIEAPEQLELRALAGECDHHEVDFAGECFYLDDELIDEVEALVEAEDLLFEASEEREALAQDAPPSAEPVPDPGSRPAQPDPILTIKSWDGGGPIRTPDAVLKGNTSHSEISDLPNDGCEVGADIEVQCPFSNTP